MVRKEDLAYVKQNGQSHRNPVTHFQSSDLTHDQPRLALAKAVGADSYRVFVEQQPRVQPPMPSGENVNRRIRSHPLQITS